MEAFNSFILAAGLSEYNMGGRRFTWMSDDGCHLSKIDRFLVCGNFLDKWPTRSVTALPRELSDHCPLVFSTNMRRFGPVPFKFFNSWLSCGDLEEVVVKSWSRGCLSSSKELNLMWKLKQLKIDIKAWRSRCYAVEEVELKLLANIISVIESKAEIVVISDVERAIRADSKKKIWEINLKKNLDLRQKAKVRWGAEGDENSKFFHGIVNGNLKRSNINGISLNGIWETDVDLVKNG
ncbi:uncharacterized protein LOC143591213 [Bidens hawaiensis]|uniref:uncharacterized protein LOC143591213 n=1 Tax=Bidens hawaiensis TaxID=980011 RepID=UPI00404A72BB